MRELLSTQFFFFKKIVLALPVFQRVEQMPFCQTFRCFSIDLTVKRLLPSHLSDAIVLGQIYDLTNWNQSSWSFAKF